ATPRPSRSSSGRSPRSRAPGVDERSTRDRRSGRHRREQAPARLLAAPALLGADLAVLHHLCVALAFITTALARGDARLQQRPGQVGVVLGLSGDDPAHGATDIGAVQVQADALGETLEVALRQAGIST